MPKASRTSPASPPPKGQMLFLVGHGLQTPLSAIRWGCSRLTKMGKGSMTKEQLQVLADIRHESKILSGMLNGLLLVARVEDGMHEPRIQDVYLHDFLESFAPFKQLFPGSAVKVTCPADILLKTDRTILEPLLEAVCVILGTASAQKKAFVIAVSQEKKNCVLRFSPELELSFLRDLSTSKQADTQMVGGASGLMLSVASSLSQALGGRIQLEKQGKDRHVLSLKIPLRHTVSS